MSGSAFRRPASLLCRLPLVRRSNAPRRREVPITPVASAQDDFLRRPLPLGTRPTVTTCKASTGDEAVPRKPPRPTPAGGRAGASDDESGNDLLHRFQHVDRWQHRMQRSSPGLRTNRRRVNASDLLIGDGAQVEGSVLAQDVTVCGSVKGAIRAVRVRLQNGGAVQGDIFHRWLAIDEISLLKDRRDGSRIQRRHRPAPIPSGGRKTRKCRPQFRYRRWTPICRVSKNRYPPSGPGRPSLRSTKDAEMQPPCAASLPQVSPRRRRY
jgi:Polymer-forming cytoskeletal